MKKLITFLALIVLAGQGYAQYFPDTAWTRCYGGSGNDYGMDIQQTYDAGYIVLGRTVSDDGDLANTPAGYKVWIMKLDSLGNIEWQRHYTDLVNVYNIRQTTDSGYIVGGANFYKLKPDGTDYWLANIPCISVLQAYDGGYALLADDHRIYKLSPVLATEWTADLTFMIEHSFDPRSPLIQTVDSGFAFCGDWKDIPLSEFIRGGWLCKVSKNGITEIDKQYGDVSYRNLKQGHDEKFILVGALEDVFDEIYTGIEKSDSFAIWKKDITNYIANDIVENIDTTLVICGQTKTAQSADADAFISKRLSTGDSLITLELGGSQQDNFETVIPTKDTGYIVTGTTRSNDGNIWGHHGGSDLWIVKFKQDTSVHVPPPVITSVNKPSRINDVKVYPTLTTGIVNVLLPTGYEQASIKAFNIIGQPLNISTSGSGAKRTISIANQPAGQYILEVRQGTERKSFIITLNP